MKHETSARDIQQQYIRDGYKAMKALRPGSASDAFYMAALAFGEEDTIFALECVRVACEMSPKSALFHHAATYLERVIVKGKLNVYVDGDAFAAFIRGGGNRALYTATSAALHAVYEEYESLSVLDIGTGDGLALLPALHENIHSLTVLEPSETLLQTLCAALDQRGNPPYRAIHDSVQHFAATCVRSEQWDAIESTFCLHGIVPEERTEMLTWMRAHGKRVLIAEFDVPDFPGMYAPERIFFFMTRYEQGLMEYADDGGLVAQGFLMPILFGNFDRTRARSTYEQPIAHWEEELTSLGFTSIHIKKLFPYWWSPACLLDAR